VFLLFLWFGLIPSLISAEIEKEPQPISSLHWGEVLFHHFKGNKMDALIRLYARESRGNLTPHQGEASLLAAGLLLDLGLATEAQKRLETIDAKDLKIPLKSRLALIMARVFFQDQDFTSATAWLERADEQYLNVDEVTNKKMMQAQLLFSTGEFAQAALKLESIENTGNLKLYAEYNHGLSLLKLSEPAAQQQGRTLLNNLSDIKPIDQEQYALIDQAKLALGLNAINSGFPDDAREKLFGIRLDGLVSNDALLLLGWTYAQTAQFEEALTYWNKLSEKKQLLEPAIQEAWLAVPYAHQQLGDLRQAVKGFENAVLAQIDAQNQLQNMLNQQSWRILLNDNSNNSNNILPGVIRRQLIANPNFYNLLLTWQQLEQLHKKLQSSLTVLPTIRLFLTENRSEYEYKSKQIQQKISFDAAQTFVKNYQQLQQQFEQQKTQPVTELLLSEEDYAHWAKLDAIKTIINAHPDKIDIKKQDKFHLVDGVAKWKFHRKSAHDSWLAEDSLNKLKQSLGQLTKQQQRLKLLVNKPRDSTTNNDQRLQTFDTRAQLLRQQIIELQQQLESAMADEFFIHVQQRQLALKELAEQANLALARLSFKAIEETSDNE